MFPARLTAFTAACAGMLLAAPPALAASSATGENTPLNLPAAGPTQTASSGGGPVRTIVRLAIVLAVIYGTYWPRTEVKGSREPASSGQGLEPLARIPLGPNRALHLVRPGR